MLEVNYEKLATFFMLSVVWKRKTRGRKTVKYTKSLNAWRRWFVYIFQWLKHKFFIAFRDGVGSSRSYTTSSNSNSRVHRLAAAHISPNNEWLMSTLCVKGTTIILNFVLCWFNLRNVYETRYSRISHKERKLELN